MNSLFRCQFSLAKKKQRKCFVKETLLLKHSKRGKECVLFYFLRRLLRYMSGIDSQPSVCVPTSSDKPVQVGKFLKTNLIICRYNSLEKLHTTYLEFRVSIFPMHVSSRFATRVLIVAHCERQKRLLQFQSYCQE